MFGYPFHEKAEVGWQARAIFKPRLERPLDLLPDRQGGMVQDADSDPTKWTEQEKAVWEQFHKSMKMAGVLPALQKLAQGFTIDSREVLCKHFPYMLDEKTPSVNCVLVAQGSPNGSYGYFYLAVQLMRKEDAPPAVETQGERADRESVARKAEMDRWLAQDAAQRRRLAVERRLARAQQQEKRREIESRLHAAPFKVPGQPLVVGDCVRVYANQGDREAFVKAIVGNEALIEYYMPSGKAFLRIINTTSFGEIRSVSAKSLPKKWREQMEEVVV